MLIRWSFNVGLSVKILQESLKRSTSLVKYEADPRINAQVHFVRPKEARSSHVFRVLIHIDAVDDLMFYHYPREVLIADGKIPWRDFN
jgi:hypothetical protein